MGANVGMNDSSMSQLNSRANGVADGQKKKIKLSSGTGRKAIRFFTSWSWAMAAGLLAVVFVLASLLSGCGPNLRSSPQLSDQVTRTLQWPVEFWAASDDVCANRQIQHWANQMSTVSLDTFRRQLSVRYVGGALRPSVNIVPHSALEQVEVNLQLEDQNGRLQAGEPLQIVMDPPIRTNVDESDRVRYEISRHMDQPVEDRLLEVRAYYRMFQLTRMFYVTRNRVLFNRLSLASPSQRFGEFDFYRARNEVRLLREETRTHLTCGTPINLADLVSQ